MRSYRTDRGFTVMEVLVVSGVMAVLVLIISSAWAGVGRPIVDMIARCRLVEEIDLATDSLVRDLGGSLANSEGRLGGKEQSRFLGWMQSDQCPLLLRFDGGGASTDTVIAYLVDENNRLVRWDQNANTVFTVAENVNSLQVTPVQDTLQIQLTFSYQNFTRTCTFIARTP